MYYFFTEMSSVWKYPTSSPRKQELMWMNIFYSTHDQFCECDDPVLHFMILVNRDSNTKKPTSDIRNIKCLLTGKTTTAEEEDTEPTPDEGGFIDGELEQLFKEEDGPENKEPDDLR